MALLVILVPPRPRLASRSAVDPAVRPAAEFDHVLSADGRTVAAVGRSSSAASLPAADSVLAVLADADVSWHRITVPKAPAARQRAALAGLMEEVLLDDEEAVHFALPPQHAGGQPAWVAVVHKPWLVATLAELEASGRVVDRVVPASAPGGAARGHFFRESAEDGAPTLSLAHADGAVVLRASGSLARALLPADASTVRWTATPAAAGAAEHWLDARVDVLGEAERALESARSLWNLRQFDLLPRHRGTRAVRETARRLLSPEWRPVRWGAAALVAVQVLGLNVWAWQQDQAVEEKRTAMTALLRTAHPGVRAVLDPPAQMRRETERLRTAAGRAGDGDLEVLLAASAAAWPDGQGPVQTLRFEGGRLTLAAPGWGEAQMAQFRERLRPAGYTVELADGRVTVARAARKAA